MNKNRESNLKAGEEISLAADLHSHMKKLAQSKSHAAQSLKFSLQDLLKD